MEISKYVCNVCFFKTNRKNDYDRHINKKNKCIASAILPDQLPALLPEINNIIEPVDNSMELLLKEIQLMKEQLIEKNKIITTLQEQQKQPQQKKSKNIKNDILIKINNDYKNAIRFDDFINNMLLDEIDFECWRYFLMCAIGKKVPIQYANGICNLFMFHYNKLPENQRPIVCSNIKTKTFYIKVGDKWEIDNLSTKWELVDLHFKNIMGRLKSEREQYRIERPNRDMTPEEVRFVPNVGSFDYAMTKIIPTLAKLLDISGSNNNGEDTDSGSEDNEPKLYNKYTKHDDDPEQQAKAETDAKKRADAYEDTLKNKDEKSVIADVISTRKWT
jgi:hypothetical protein